MAIREYLVKEADFTKANAALEIGYGAGPWPDKSSAKLYEEAVAPLAAPGLIKRGQRTVPVLARFWAGFGPSQIFEIF